MKPSQPARKRGFSLIETVIAIGVLAVLLTGFMIVFAPAAAGVRKAINVQEADRLATTLEQELVTFRTGDQGVNGFGKAFTWIKESNVANNALMIYQYRGSLIKSPRTTDQTPEPVTAQEMNDPNMQPGKGYAVRTMVRRKSDPKFLEDLKAVEGSVYVVKCTQLVFSGGELKPGTIGQIKDPKPPNADSATPDLYPEAVIAFAAEFHALPTRSPDYLTGAQFNTKFPNLKTPVFTRNLAVRR
jgi:prepilin-type N-terminal cleavage/methylation domain-containing protein